MATATSRSGAVTTYTYDAQGRLTEVALPDPDAPSTSDRSEEVTYCTATPDDRRVRTLTDAGGTVTEYAYGQPADPGYPCAGSDSMPTSVTAAAGTTAEATTLVASTAGLPTEVTDPDGVVTRYRWDAGRGLLLARERDADPGTPGTEVTFFAYDGAGRLLVERRPSGIETWRTYDAAGNVTGVVGPVTAPSRGCTALGDTCTFPGSPPIGAPTETYTYRRDDTLASYTDRDGETWTFDREVLGGGGREEVETAPDGMVRTRTYDSAGRLVTEVVGDPAVPAELATTTYTYGALGRLASVTDPTGVETRYGYDADGNITEVIDEDDESTVTTYDPEGRVVSEVDPLGHETTYAYGPTGLVEEVVDRTGATTTHTYDPLGRLLTTTDARGGVVTRTYTPGGRLASETDPTNRTTTYDHDGAGRLVEVTSPSGAETTLAYDVDGRVTSETSPEGRVESYTYDAADRMLTVDDPRTGLTTSTYSPRGDLLTRTDATGGQVVWDRDEVGRVTSVTDPLGRATTYAYDSRGNRVLRTDALLGEREWRYDLADRLVEEIDPLDRSTTYTYDHLGRLDVKTDAAGRTETHGYDAAGQVTSLAYASGTPTTFQYDEEGRRTRMTDASGPTTWYRNAIGLITGVNNPGDRDLAFAWDLAGRRTIIDYPDGARYRQRYDTDGRLSEVEIDDGGTWVDVAVNTYDDDGLLTDQDQGASGSRAWTYGPATGRVTSYSDTRGGVTTTTSLTHDAAGRIESATTGGTSTVYDYDAAGQLVLVDNSTGDDATYAYDELGRRTTSTDGPSTTTYQWDAASQLNRRVVDGVNHNYQYDASGRRTREAWDGGTHVLQYFWGDRGTLGGQRYTEPGTVTHTSRSTRGDGTLSALVTTVNGATTDTTSVVWDPTLPVPQPVWTGDPGTANATRAVYGPDLIRVTCPTGTGCTGPVPHDVHGSALQTSAISAVTQDDAYSAWGEGGGTFTVGADYGYRSELHTGSTIHLRARDYDPATGLFLSPDPLDGVDGTTTVANPYHYVNNDPLNLVDPTGLRPGDECGGGLLGFVCRYQEEIIVFTASAAAGAICGLAAAPAGPFAAGAAGNVCAGAVYRGLSAYVDGEDPWAAALDPGSIAIDAALGGLLGSGGAYVDDLLRPGAGAIDDVVRPGAGGTVDDAIRGACSFSAETRVLMADGSTKPISEVRVGDWVMATDPETGESGPREVVAELPHTDELLELETSAGEIVTTEDHRYWNETDGEWQEAQDLDAGDRLRTADGDVVTVEGLDWTTVHRPRLRPHHRRGPHLLRPRRHRSRPRPQLQPEWNRAADLPGRGAG